MIGLVKPFLLVCAGGALGSGFRYLTVVWATRTFGMSFPFGTLIVNLAGSFLLALIMELTGGLLRNDLRLLLGTGILGGFTTYSAFNYETTAYLRQGSIGSAFLNITATLLGCLLAGLTGVLIARLIAGR